MSHSIRRFVSILVAAVITMALTCSVALAAPDGGPRQHLFGGTSSNWSGYAAETNLASPQSGAVSDVTGTWQVPFVTGTINAWSSAWVGIDGYASNSVEQLGTDSDTTRLRSGCSPAAIGHTTLPSTSQTRSAMSRGTPRSHR